MSTTRSRFTIYPGVNTRIIGPFLLVIIIIAAIGVFIVTNLVAGSIQERFNNQLVDSANSASNSIVDIEREYLSVMRTIAFTEGVAQALLEKDADYLDLWITPLLANNFIDEFVVFTVERDPLVMLSRQQDAIEPLYDREEIVSINDWPGVNRVISGEVDDLGDKFVDLIYIDEIPVFFFYAPVLTDELEIAGGVALGIHANTLARRVSENSLSSVTFTGFDGEILGSTFRRDTESLRLSPEQLEFFLAEVNDSSPVDEIELGGIPYQVIYAPFELRSDQLGLLSVGLPVNFITQQAATSRNVFGLLFAVMFMVVAILGLFIARTITNPVERLVYTTRAIRGGDLAQRVNLHTPDELGELGDSFDSMTDDLVKRNEQIELLYNQQVVETARREAMLTSIADAIIVQDVNGDILLENPRVEQLQGELADEPEQLAEFQRLCATPAELSEPQIASLGEYHFSVLATPVRMDTGGLLGYVIVFRDITAIIQAEKIKDELILQMSHELRTPLASVRGYVDLIKMIDGQNVSEQGMGFINSSLEHLTTLENLVNQVIDVSAMLSNRFTIDIDTFDLAYLLNQIYTRWQPEMDKRQHKLKLSLSSDEMTIKGDERRIEEMIEYLLRNAYNYTLPGGNVEIDAGTINKFVIITITDTGVGIGADEIDAVFERMYRGRSADAGPTDARGLGLGLYIARQIVEAHHGTITLKSEEEVGTTVTVTIPVDAGKQENIEVE